MDHEKRAVVRDQADLDGMWVEIRQHRANLVIIADCGLPHPDDEGAAEYQDKLVRMMAALILMELNTRDLSQ